jgi:predicted aldo/keto reductase-like oxidoreductase
MDSRASMPHRRFGKTDLSMPVLSCGGMRYQHSWNDADACSITPASQSNVRATIQRSLELGINHIETARGYGTSEVQLGNVLPAFPRDRMMVQTKVGPADSEHAFLDAFETSMRNLRLDYVDLLAVHGINTEALLDKVLTQGTLSACSKLQADGRVGHLGFSTHGNPDTIMKVIETGAFEYVNLHWYYMDQRNGPAIQAARARDMGVFVISPSDKGGKLYDPPRKLVDLCCPLHPMTFNDLWCLSHQDVHTISIGAARPSDFDTHMAVLPLLADAAKTLSPIEARLRAALVEAVGEDWANHWQEGLPSVGAGDCEIPLYHVLRLWTLAKAFDMKAFGQMRYNLLGNGGHWFPGRKVDDVDEAELRDILGDYRFADRVPDILREAHGLFNAEDKKRLSESES